MFWAAGAWSPCKSRRQHRALICTDAQGARVSQQVLPDLEERGPRLVEPPRRSPRLRAWTNDTELSSCRSRENTKCHPAWHPMLKQADSHTFSVRPCLLHSTAFSSCIWKADPCDLGCHTCCRRVSRRWGMSRGRLGCATPSGAPATRTAAHTAAAAAMRGRGAVSAPAPQASPGPPAQSSPVPAPGWVAPPPALNCSAPPVIPSPHLVDTSTAAISCRWWRLFVFQHMARNASTGCPTVFF